MARKLFLSVLLLPVFLLTSCGDMSSNTFARMRKNRQVAVGTVPFGAPLLHQEGEEFVGPDALLGARIVERVVQQVEGNTVVGLRWIGRQYATLAAALNNEEVELVIGAYGVTDERKAEVDFSEPYYSSELVLVINPIQYDIRADQLDGRKIGVREGSAVAQFVESKYASSEITPYETLDEAVFGLRRGEIHAVIDDRYMAAFSLDTVPGSTHLEIVPGTLGTIECAVAFRKGDDRLRQIIEEVVGEVKAENLYEQWLQEKVGDQFARVEKRQENRLEAAQPRRLVIRVTKDRNNAFDIYRMANLRFTLTNHDNGEKFTSSRINFQNRVGVSSTEVPPGIYRISLPRLNFTPGDVQISLSDPTQVTVTIRLTQDSSFVLTRS